MPYSSRTKGHLPHQIPLQACQIDEACVVAERRWWVAERQQERRWTADRDSHRQKDRLSALATFSEGQSETIMKIVLNLYLLVLRIVLPL